MTLTLELLTLAKYKFPSGQRPTPDMVHAISGQASDIGLVDYTFFGPDGPDGSGPIASLDPSVIETGIASNSVYHPIEKRWVRAGSFKQPSKEYIEKMYGHTPFLVCWDSTYGCFIVDYSIDRSLNSDPYKRQLEPHWTRVNTAYRPSVTPGLPIGETFKEILCIHKYPRFVGVFMTNLSQDDVTHYRTRYDNGRPVNLPEIKTTKIPEISGSMNGDKPSDDAVYDWWEEKWCRPGDHKVPDEIPEKWINNNAWYVWDTALGIYRTPRDWETKSWLDDYSSLIIDGIVSYGGVIHPDGPELHYMFGGQGDKYFGASADGEYAAFADAERAKVIKYMKGES